MTNHTALLPVEQITDADWSAAIEIWGGNNPPKRVVQILAAHRLQAPAEAGERDNCEMCLGAKGGIKGNENRILGIVMCDYCHAKVLPAISTEAGEEVERVQKITAEILGYKDWDDAKDYRLTGAQDRERDRILRIVLTALRANAPEAQGEVVPTENDTQTIARTPDGILWFYGGNSWYTVKGHDTASAASGAGDEG